MCSEKRNGLFLIYCYYTGIIWLGLPLCSGPFSFHLINLYSKRRWNEKKEWKKKKKKKQESRSESFECRNKSNLKVYIDCINQTKLPRCVAYIIYIYIFGCDFGFARAAGGGGFGSKKKKKGNDSFIFSFGAHFLF